MFAYTLNIACGLLMANCVSLITQTFSCSHTMKPNQAEIPFLQDDLINAILEKEQHFFSVYKMKTSSSRM